MSTKTASFFWNTWLMKRPSRCQNLQMWENYCYTLVNQEVATVLLFHRFCCFSYIYPYVLKRNFKSGVFKELCHLLTGPDNTCPSSVCRVVERLRRTLEQQLPKVINETQTDYYQRFTVLMDYRSSVNGRAGMTPATLVIGRDTRFPEDLMFGSPTWDLASRTAELFFVIK